MNLTPTMIVSLFLVSMNSLYAMQKAFVDDKSGRTITICEIKNKDLDSTWWEIALKLTMNLHNRKIEKDIELGEKIKMNFKQTQERFEKNPEMSLFIAIYDGEKIDGIGFGELIDNDTIIGCFHPADFKTYNKIKLLSEFDLFLKEKFPSAQCVAIAAPRD